MAILLAAAFHEAVSVQRLEALFRSNWNGLFLAQSPYSIRNVAVRSAYS
jgi:hypothetical protein